MTTTMTRRDFVSGTSAAVGLALTGLATQPLFASDGRKPLWKLSLAQWSLHKELFAKKIDNLDFAKTAKTEWGIDGVEYVNQFFKDKAGDESYLGEMKKRAAGEGVHSLLIMVDGEGKLGDPDEAKRKQAVENHHKWVEAAKFLGCHAIRVNAASGGTYQEQVKLAVDGLRKLTEFSAKHNISVIVENHGGLSSNGAWLAEVIKTVDHKGCGTLPDFGNFGIDRNKGDWYDRYTGTKELMPYAKAVSAKTYDFDESRPFVTIDSRWKKETDFLRMMKIVVDAGYNGYVGIEYEGQGLPERAGIQKSKELLDRVHAKLS
jgi:sugar phosphate isomerase/epimerase